MSDTKFTKGPWKWVGHDIESEEILAPSYGQVMTPTVSCGAYCYGGMPHIEISGADKSLIAAAPDLYEALEGMLAVTTESRWEFAYAMQQQARAALAKARGEA